MIIVDDICLSRFKSADTDVIYVITHSHSDHMRYLPLKWSRVPIHCSPTTRELLLIKLSDDKRRSNHARDILKGDLIPGQYCCSNRLYVFETVHAPGSIGVWDTKSRLLHIGDGRLTHTVLQKIHEGLRGVVPMQIVNDHHHDRVPDYQPPWREDIAAVQTVFTVANELGIGLAFVCHNTSVLTALDHAGFNTTDGSSPPYSLTKIAKRAIQLQGMTWGGRHDSTVRVVSVRESKQRKPRHNTFYVRLSATHHDEANQFTHGMTIRKIKNTGAILLHVRVSYHDADSDRSLQTNKQKNT